LRQLPSVSEPLCLQWYDPGYRLHATNE